MNGDLKKYFDEIVPPVETVNNIKEEIKREKKLRSLKITLALRIACSFAVCLLFGMAVNMVNGGSGSYEVLNTPITITIATAFGSPSGFVIGGTLFAVICAAFILIYVKKKKV